MKVEFHRKFAKDLSKILVPEVLLKIREVILQLEETDDLRTLSQVKALKGGGGYLRIRAGDYRIGMQHTADGGVLLLSRISRHIRHRASSPFLNSGFPARCVWPIRSAMKSNTTMRILSVILFTALCVIQPASGFAEPMALETQAVKAKAILRIVVVSHDILKFNEGSQNFQALAKCRVIADYRGDYSLGEFIYIPCAYNYDEDPSPIDAKGDYVVFLDVLETVSIGHPIAYNAVYPITLGRIDDPNNKGKEIALAEFVARVAKIRKETPNKADMAPPRKPSE